MVESVYTRLKLWEIYIISISSDLLSKK
jgi:hypothetical protein